jgi:hypothetical protein
MNHLHQRHETRLAGLGVAMLLATLLGCATERPRTAEPLERHQVLTELAAGQLRLRCELACAASWRLERSTLRGLYANKLWGELAVAVARVGYTSDLSYFYLGRAAEEMGNLKAAETYFRFALAATSRCNGWLLNGCDGAKLPAEAASGLSRVSRQ